MQGTVDSGLGTWKIVGAIQVKRAKGGGARCLDEFAFG